MFYPRDLDIILKMRLVTSQKDYWVWNHSKDGVYSAKSGNWLANQEKHQPLIQNMVASPAINSLRKHIWASQSPLKIKNFMWRALGNVIPVVDTVSLKGMRIYSRCQRCGLERESVNHVLFQCCGKASLDIVTSTLAKERFRFTICYYKLWLHYISEKDETNSFRDKNKHSLDCVDPLEE